MGIFKLRNISQAARLAAEKEASGDHMGAMVMNQELSGQMAAEQLRTQTPNDPGYWPNRDLTSNLMNKTYINPETQRDMAHSYGAYQTQLDRKRAIQASVDTRIQRLPSRMVAQQQLRRVPVGRFALRGRPMFRPVGKKI